MTDGVSITAGSGTTIATDDISGTHYQKVKLAFGANDSATDVNTGAGLPVSDAGGSLTVDGTVAISGTVAVTDNSGTLSIDDGAGSITVDGTVSAAQSGTWTVQPGNTANTTAWKVDGSAVTQPVSGTVAVSSISTSVTPGTGASNLGKAEDAASADGDVGVMALAVRKATPGNTSGTDGDYEPLQVSGGYLWVNASGQTLTVGLPSGASTAAKQPALGTAGSASADVISIQGIASMTAVKVDGSAVTQPVSGTVTATASGDHTVVGKAASGAAVSGNPVLIAGSDGTNAVSVKTDSSGNQRVRQASVTTSTLTNVSSSATNVTVFSSNSSALARTVYNDSTQVLYLKFGTTASSTSFTAYLAANSYYEFPLPLYTGQVDGIWASANGSARITELT